MAGAAGLEPVTSAVTGQRSNQLSYAPARGDAQIKGSLAERQGLVPAFQDSESHQNPGHATRLLKLCETAAAQLELL